jgi:HK97 family phage major capsid protein
VALLLATEAGTGLLAPLLGADPTSATSRSILGVPLYVSQYAPANTVYALDSTRVTLVIREDSTVAVSTDAYFSSDRVGVRAVMRAGFAFPHPASVAKITLA